MRPSKSAILGAAVCVSLASAGAGFLFLDGASRPSEAATLAVALADPSEAASVPPSPIVLPSVLPSPSVKVSRTPEVRKVTVTRQASTKPTVRSPKTYRLSPVTAYFSQAAIDQCKLVLFGVSPTNLIAAHNDCGYGWLDNIPTGSIVIVTTGPAAGKYKVVGHKWLDEKGGRAPSWLGDYDLVLQTCTTHGTGFSVAVRIG